MSAPANTAIPGNTNVLYWLIRGVFLESIRRRELYVVLLFMGLFLLGSITARIVGAESDAAASFIINLGLSLAWILSLVVAILMAARQFPDEQEQRSLYPLLAKSVSRNQYITGKWLATWLTGGVTALALNLLVFITAPLPQTFSMALFTQSLVFEITAIAMATAIAIVLSIRLPKALTIVITGLLTFAGGPLITMLHSQLAVTSASPAVAWIIHYIPNFSRLDLINSLSAGGSPLAITDFMVRALSAAIVTFFALAAAMAMLERKPL